jgi:Na+-translocating ferredoxin:NAD+ oxidoreductase RnfG subunit
MKRRQFIVGFTAGVAALGVAAPAAFAQDRRYLSQDQALRLVFPSSQRIARENYTLTAAQLAAVQNALRVRLATDTQTIFRGVSNDATDGYAMILDEIGKDQPITFIVGVTPDYHVSRVALMVFRETRGWEVEDARFTNQFRGKTLRNRIAVGSDIVGVTGATLSSRAFCRGARKALAICEAIFQ